MAPDVRGFRGKRSREELSSYGFGDPVGAALAAAETVGEACAGLAPGDDPGDDCAPADAGEVCEAG